MQTIKRATKPCAFGGCPAFPCGSRPTLSQPRLSLQFCRNHWNRFGKRLLAIRNVRNIQWRENGDSRLQKNLLIEYFGVFVSMLQNLIYGPLQILVTWIRRAHVIVIDRYETPVFLFFMNVIPIGLAGWQFNRSRVTQVDEPSSLRTPIPFAQGPGQIRSPWVTMTSKGSISHIIPHSELFILRQRRMTW